jgi:hypothetical protein
MLRQLAIAVALLGCHHDSAPPIVAPDEVPPLPPASGTPIGFLVDAATQLKLTDDQVTKLREIDSGLAAELEVIDSQLHDKGKAVGNGSNDPAPQQGRRGRHGGGGGGRHRGSGAGSGSGSATASSGDLNRLADQRSADLKDALKRAFALLDPAQQAAAQKLLADHDVDVDRPKAPEPEPGEDPDVPGEP